MEQQPQQPQQQQQSQHHRPRELFALAAWIQTFPEFDVQIYNGGEQASDAERLVAALDTSEATKYVLLAFPTIIVFILLCCVVFGSFVYLFVLLVDFY